MAVSKQPVILAKRPDNKDVIVLAINHNETIRHVGVTVCGFNFDVFPLLTDSNGHLLIQHPGNKKYYLLKQNNKSVEASTVTPAEYECHNVIMKGVYDEQGFVTADPNGTLQMEDATSVLYKTIKVTFEDGCTLNLKAVNYKVAIIDPTDRRAYARDSYGYRGFVAGTTSSALVLSSLGIDVGLGTPLVINLFYQAMVKVDRNEFYDPDDILSEGLIASLRNVYCHFWAYKLNKNRISNQRLLKYLSTVTRRGFTAMFMLMAPELACPLVDREGIISVTASLRKTVAYNNLTNLLKECRGRGIM